MKNELSNFEEVQGRVIILSLIQKVLQSLPLETLCPFNGPRQTLHQLFIISCLHSIFIIFIRSH